MTSEEVWARAVVELYTKSLLLAVDVPDDQFDGLADRLVVLINAYMCGVIDTLDLTATPYEAP